MLSNETIIRVRYCETDRMGYVHHGNYASYFEIGRTELLRNLGFSYRKMEDDGILLPVRELKIQFFLPAYYDEELSLTTSLINKPSIKIEFQYELKNSKNEIISKAEATLVFVDANTRKPTRMPEYFKKCISEYF